MSVSSLNQVRQLYVATNVISDAATPIANPGDVKVKKTKNNEVYFEVYGALTPLKSDYIPLKNLEYAKKVSATSMNTPLKKIKVSLVEAPIAGQDYILRINFRQFYGMSDQDQYIKDAAIHVDKAMAISATAKQDFYKAMEKALNLSFSRELGATRDSNPYLKFSATEEGIFIEEKEQPWTLGVEAQERVYFDVIPTTVYDGVDDVIWGKVETQPSTSSIPNGHNMADLEYFLLGERGDQYRKIGWPNDIETKGMVDPSLSYDVFELHYSFTDTGVNSYKTEKDITIIAPTLTGKVSSDSIIDKVITQFETATGLTVDKGE